MYATGACEKQETGDPLLHASGLRARVWIAAPYFFSRQSAQDYCWLWLHAEDGHVHALWLPAHYRDRDDLLPALAASLAADAEMPIVLESGPFHAQPLPHAPVVPVPRWSVSWGHPVQRAIRAFAASLDTAVIDALGQLEVHGLFFGCTANYNRLAADAQPTSRHRTQVLAQFPPLVAPLLLDQRSRPDLFNTDEDEPGDLRMAHASPAVLDAIDRGRDLIGALAEHHHIDRALVRSPLCRAPWTAGHAPRELLRLLNAIPAHARPRTREELETRLPHLRALPLRARSQRDVERLAAAFAQGWTGLWQHLERRFVPLATTLPDTRDFLQAAIDQTVLPPELRHLDANTLALGWLARRGLASLLDASRRWHAQPLVAEALPATNEAGAEVPTLLGEMNIAEGHLRELVTHAALIEEGESMHHCVGDYWHDCVLAGTRLFHLRAPDAAAATAEYHFDHGANRPRFRLAQLRGPCNAECTTAMHELARRVEALLNAPHLNEQRRELARKAGEERLADRQALGRRRALDARSRRELASVLAYCAGQDDWRTANDEIFRGHIAGFQYAEGPRLLDRIDPGDALHLVREPANPTTHSPCASTGAHTNSAMCRARTTHASLRCSAPATR